MSRHYHILTCDDENILDYFINTGMAGIRPVKSKKGSLNKTVELNWDILADIARIKKGDYVFLHSKGFIQGVFEVTSNPIIEQNYARLFNGPNIETNIWKNNWSNIKSIISQNQYIWWIPIRPVDGLFFEKLNMDVVFDRIAEGIINSLPQRLRYEDKNKTVKGITKTDFEEIIHLFYNYSSLTSLSTQRIQYRNYLPIDFDYLTNDGYEKNVEAIVVYRVRSGTFMINGLHFSHTNVLNTVPLGYLKMADVLTWSEINKIVNPWIWELKRDKVRVLYDVYSRKGKKVREGLFDIIKRLSSRASHLNSILKNGYKITGVIIAKDFSSAVITSFNNVVTPIGSLEEIILISYTGIGKNLNFSLIARK